MLDLDLIFVFPPLFFNIGEWIFFFFFVDKYISEWCSKWIL